MQIADTKRANPFELALSKRLVELAGVESMCQFFKIQVISLVLPIWCSIKCYINFLLQKELNPRPNITFCY